MDSPFKGGICFIGDSIFTYWANIEKDLAPHPVYNAAFGGSVTSSVLQFTDQLVSKYTPTTVVYHCGNNDIAKGLTAEGAVDGFKQFVQKVRKSQSNIRIMVLQKTQTPYQVAKGEAKSLIQIDELIQEFIKEDSKTANQEIKFIYQPEYREEHWLDDLYHLNALGHREMGKAIIDHLT